MITFTGHHLLVELSLLIHISLYLTTYLSSTFTFHWNCISSRNFVRQFV